MINFKTQILLNDLREFLNLIENDSKVIEHSASIRELRILLKSEIDRLEKEIDADLVNQAKPSVGVPF